MSLVHILITTYGYNMDQAIEVAEMVQLQGYTLAEAVEEIECEADRDNESDLRAYFA